MSLAGVSCAYDTVTVFSAQRCLVFNWDFRLDSQPGRTEWADWGKFMWASPGFPFNWVEFTHNSWQSSQMSLATAATTLADIHQRIFHFKVLTYQGAVLQYCAASTTSDHGPCSWGWQVPLFCIVTRLQLFTYVWIEGHPLQMHELLWKN